MALPWMTQMYFTEPAAGAVNLYSAVSPGSAMVAETGAPFSPTRRLCGVSSLGDCLIVTVTSAPAGTVSVGFFAV
jgi:hypothetical protein